MAKNKNKRKEDDFMSYLTNNVAVINNSKLFAGLMIIIINVAPKFMAFKISKTMESYIKFTFSRNLLVFAIAWMGTRDIFIALIVTLLFIVVMDHLLNEESPFCCLSDDFKEHYLNMLEIPPEVTPDDVKRARQILEQFETQTKENFVNKKVLQSI
jgi:hypothetical protein